MAALRPFSFVSSRLQFRRFARGEEATILTIRNEINALKYLPWWTTLSSEQGGSRVWSAGGNRPDALLLLEREGTRARNTQKPWYLGEKRKRWTARAAGDCHIDARDTAMLAGAGAAGFATISQGMWAAQFPYYIVAM
ncbi:hypothetical protein DACRYDRAFT_97958 [Dacryopinax primogenitus]|uniref:Uncharacterized protein n=1 Tax=Dacryopinax primogenitus (strain DJM 731) TaxID=1858805 RepID=M5G8M3_DACPD|nr:uncharacterized protein DACRYDRAFT_97958 [Dacryopinax primogenitus]EJU06566.1 hypothetical protein DACRYDRAFT_97958 [Dacryopinax primogenitus]